MDSRRLAGRSHFSRQKDFPGLRRIWAESLSFVRSLDILAGVTRATCIKASLQKSLRNSQAAIPADDLGHGTRDLPLRTDRCRYDSLRHAKSLRSP